MVGTTGLTDDQLSELKALAESGAANCFIAPNFAIGAVLMMEASKLAAPHLKNVEIIELHHEQKLDAPSGTAKRTAELIERGRRPRRHPDSLRAPAGHWSPTRKSSSAAPGRR